MITQEKRKIRFISVLLVFLLLAAVAAHYVFDPWGFYWKVSEEEAVLRRQVVEAAERYLGCCEADGSHQPIIDDYNAHEPLALG